MVIDWSTFGSKFIKIKDGDKKRLVLTNWEQKEKTFGNTVRSVLEFEVLSEDGVPCDPPKTFEASGTALVSKLKPYIVAAEDSGAAFVDLNVVRVGSGLTTVYSVTQN